MLRAGSRLSSYAKEFCRRGLQTGSVTMEKKQHIDQTSHSWRDVDSLAGKVTKLEDISPTVRRLTVSLDKSAINSSFKAGQWVDFFIPGEPQVGGFSMWNSPDNFSRTGDIELAIKFSKWPPAHWVHTTCKEGNDVGVRFGGDFFYPSLDINKEEAHSVLLIAGGVGINPLLSIWLHARDLWKGGEETIRPERVHLTYSAATEQELIFKSMVECTTSEFSNFTSSYFITSAGANYTGRITEQELGARVSKLRPGRLVAYLCGPPDMIKDVTKTLISLGVPAGDIRYELWY